MLIKKCKMRALDILNRLIDEHILNPPLTWEEIKKDMWCWDNTEKENIFIFKAWMSPSNVRLIQYYGMDEAVMCQFENGRFYRKEVRNEC